MKTLIKNARIINEGQIFDGAVLIDGELISRIFHNNDIPDQLVKSAAVIDVAGQYLIPGAIDDQVHFREPGLTHKGEIATESRAAVARRCNVFHGNAQHQSTGSNPGNT